MLGAAWLNMRVFLLLGQREVSSWGSDTPAQGGLPPEGGTEYERTLMFGGLIYCVGLTLGGPVSRPRPAGAPHPMRRWRRATTTSEWFRRITGPKTVTHGSFAPRNGSRDQALDRQIRTQARDDQHDPDDDCP